jgi:hypothetical protein
VCINLWSLSNVSLWHLLSSLVRILQFYKPVEINFELISAFYLLHSLCCSLKNKTPHILKYFII